eukprot:gene2779-3565_t
MTARRPEARNETEPEYFERVLGKPPRAAQIKILPFIRDRVTTRSDNKGVLEVGTGCGKTLLGLYAGAVAARSKIANRLVYVCSSISLQTQLAHACKNLGEYPIDESVPYGSRFVCQFGRGNYWCADRVLWTLCSRTPPSPTIPSQTACGAVPQRLADIDLDLWIRWKKRYFGERTKHELLSWVRMRWHALARRPELARDGDELDLWISKELRATSDDANSSPCACLKCKWYETALDQVRAIVDVGEAVRVSREDALGVVALLQDYAGFALVKASPESDCHSVPARTTFRSDERVKRLSENSANRLWAAITSDSEDCVCLQNTRNRRRPKKGVDGNVGANDGDGAEVRRNRDSDEVELLCPGRRMSVAAKKCAVYIVNSSFFFTLAAHASGDERETPLGTSFDRAASS